MSLPNVDAKVGKLKLTLSMPIAGLEEVGKVNPYPEELWNAFRGLPQLLADGTIKVVRQYRVDELKAVLAAALKWGGNSMTAEELIDAIGVTPAADLAEQVMAAALRSDAAKKADAAPETGSAS